MTNKNVYNYDERVAEYVRSRIRSGATITSIVESCAARFDNTPSDPRTFGKYYGKVIQEEKARLEDEIGTTLIARSKESDKLLEFLARTRGNFNPVDKVGVAELDKEDLDEDSVVKDMLRLLGKGVDDEEDE